SFLAWPARNAEGGTGEWGANARSQRPIVHAKRPLSLTATSPASRFRSPKMQNLTSSSLGGSTCAAGIGAGGFVREQPAVAANLQRRARLCEKAPEHHLIRRDHRAY